MQHIVIFCNKEYYIFIFKYKYISQRLAVLKLLQSGDWCVNDLVLQLKLPQPKVSMILKDLLDLKLVTVLPVAKKRFYKINYEILGQYIFEIKKIISDFDGKRSNEIIVRRKVLFSN